MPKKRFSSEEIIHKLREAEVLSSQGRTIVEISRQLGITEQTYFRWRKEYGGLKVDQAKRLKDLEMENARLRRALSDAVIDNQIQLRVARIFQHSDIVQHAVGIYADMHKRGAIMAKVNGLRWVILRHPSHERGMQPVRIIRRRRTGPQQATQ